MKKVSQKATSPEEVRKHIEALEAEVAYLKELSRSKDEFIRITNHELHTPLDVIRGNLDMVLKGETGTLPAKTREYLQDALLGADRLSKLVNDTLSIARIETGRMEFKLEDIDLSRLLETIHSDFTPIAKERELSLYLELSPPLPHVLSDTEKLFQIIDNLLGNSLKFTPRGGSITIRAWSEDDSVVVAVHDTGIGIRPEDKVKLFKKFPQIDTSMIEAPKGTGLGLYLVWQLVEKLGGEIWIESPGLGKGAMFSFRLPRSGSERAKELERYHSVFLASQASESRA